MNEREELQKKLVVYKALEDRINSLVKQQNVFASKLVELQNSIEGIKEIIGKPGKEVLFPLGSAAYMKGAVLDNSKLVVEVGAGVALEKTADEARRILEERKKEFEYAIDSLQKDVESISMMMQQIESEAQDMINAQNAQKAENAEDAKAEEKFKVLPG